MIDHNRIPELAAKAFDGLTRAELLECVKLLGIKIGPASKDDTIRRLLCQTVGTETGPIAEKKIAKLQTARKWLNLTPNGKWEGRYRRVKLLRTPEFQNIPAHPLGWEDNVRYYHFDTVVDMMYPHYEALKNMMRGTITEKQQLNQSTGDKETVKVLTESPVIPYQDYGDTPGTEHLPISMIDYMQNVYAEEGQWKKASRAKLLSLLGRVMGGEVPANYLKDKTDEMIRHDLLRRINIHEEYEDADFEVAAA